MIVKLRLFFLPLVLILVSGLSWQAIVAQTSQKDIYDEETGHWIRDDFLALWLEAIDPIRIFGRPITEAFSPDPGSPITIQYFQKARFISLIDDTGLKRVYFEPLGHYLYEPGSPEARIESPSACRFFPETGYSVCYAFLEFYEAHGGVKQFGFPISNVELHNGFPAQYFDYARLEWHPALPSGERVVVSDLGYDYFFEVLEDPSLLGPVKNASIDGFLRLQVCAYPHYAVTGLQGQQTIYITVRDQRNMPVPGAHVDLVVHWPNGDLSNYAISTLTNEQGITQYDFPFTVDVQGITIVDAIVSYRSLRGDTVTSFRIWW